MTPPPAVADADWQDWLSRFPPTFPDAAVDPGRYRKAVELATDLPRPDRGRLTPPERAAVIAFLDRHHAALKPAAEAGSFAEATIGAGIAVVGVGALLNPPLAVAGALLVVGVALYQLAKVGFAGAGEDRTRTVMDKLAQIARTLA